MRQPQRALKRTNVFVQLIANGDQRRAGVRASGQVARSALDRICDGGRLSAPNRLAIRLVMSEIYAITSHKSSDREALMVYM